MSIAQKVFMARVADQAERPEDMVQFLKEIVTEKSEDLTVEERNLLSVGFKNLIGARRTAYRTVAAIEGNKKYEEHSKRCGEYKKKIEEELVKICEEIIQLIIDQSLNKASDAEAKAFYLKMIGDYYRYIAEAVSGDKLASVGDSAEKYYQQAADVANADLHPRNPIRLGLALNFSVFHYEVRNDSKKACELARFAKEEAEKNQKEGDSTADVRDTESILGLLKENLTLWEEAENDEGQLEVEDA